ncbi:SecDF P1 head subdomain-containing protein [Parasphingorhabdus halotolerans]|uniref:SecDF P1 head subdomain domain-containing protein n=1 Tax=Parasphingorhabdus halotolerans TaxID=2725558 RepID=A0A6H2DI55_9SPHN|nr:hypothetical protein [Parasphingorhabdus halotolerans]QJB68349.1 hypothetical protein HF685_02700 [Parasphingorhabdus halotolerans]
MSPIGAFLLLAALVDPAVQPSKQNDCYKPADAAVVEETPTFHLTPEKVHSASASLDPITATPVLQLTLTDVGNTEFVKLQRCKIGKRIAIYIDGKMVSEPVLMEPILGGEIVISGSFTTEELVEIQSSLTRP